jgi:ADP-heptose:LPS heptosyltransferase
MHRFLVINPFGIGDVLFTLPVVRALKKQYPDCYIGYWCNERVGDLLKGDKDIGSVFALSRGDIKRIYGRAKRGYRGKEGANKGIKGFIRGIEGVLVLLGLIAKIRKEKFDIAYDFSFDSRYGLWSKWAGIKKRIGYDYKGRGRFLTEKMPLSGYSGRHVVEYYMDLLGISLGGAPLGVPYHIDVSPDAAARAKDRLAGLKSAGLIIGIAPGGGASWGRDAIYKQWPAEKFSEVAQRCVKDRAAGIVLLGSADEKTLCVQIASARLPAGLAMTNGKPILDLSGQLGLEELAAVIKELDLLVCNDGGPLHMAVALGTPTVSVFGPVDEKVYGPYPAGTLHAVVTKNIACRPCYKNLRFNGCTNGRKCTLDISVDEVYGKVAAVLKERVCAR